MFGKAMPGGGILGRPEPRREVPTTHNRPSGPDAHLAVPRMFKKGGKVKKTGYAKVHKGETIIPASPAAKVMGGKKPNKMAVKKAAKEIKNNPPAILKKTARKKGKAQAEKQRVAIMLSKARRGE